MENINFKSRIRACGLNEFSRATGSYKKHFVDFPWTTKESVYATKAYTTDVYDCTVCGITDGAKVLLLHICPSIEKNLRFSKIEKFINEKLNLENPDLQGFLLGSRPKMERSPNSTKLFDYFESFMEKYKIPCTKIKGSQGETDIAYSSTTDEWLIGSKEFDGKKDSEEFIKEQFNEVALAECDEFV